MKQSPILRIAKWEIVSGAGGFDRRALLITVGLIVVIGGLAPVVATSTAAPDDGIYRIGVDTDSPYYEPLVRDPKFAVRDPDSGGLATGDLDIVVTANEIRAPDTQKGRAAAGALKAAVEQYNDYLMGQESDQAAAFPVSVQIQYVERDVSLILQREGTDSASSSEDGGQQGGSDSDGGGGDGASEDGDDASGQDDGGGGGPLPFGGGQHLLLGQTSGSPSDITPPFPFVSLVLAFAFIVPMNFVIQAYASSLLRERNNRRGELLLVTPVSRWSIITGKTLPYFVLMLGIAAVTAVLIGGGLVSLAAVIPVALLFLGSAFVGGLLARSHKELTFVLVTISVVLTTYVFVPAIFTQVHPIAAISPLTLVVRDLQGTAVDLGTYVFSTSPVYLASVALFVLGAGLYREEDLFTQRPIPAKVLDALSGPIRRPASAGVMSLFAIPFVFLAELLAVAVLFVLPLTIALPVLLVIIAVIEEAAKSLHLYAGFERGRYQRTLRTAGIVGGFSGLGFFIGEKSAAVAQLVGLPDLQLGRAAFELSAGTGGGSGLILLGLLVFPLGLHVLTAVISAIGASRNLHWYSVAFLFAVAIHTAYNLTVVMLLG